jgi:purine-binding chemotaxis protein CheW
MIRAARALRGHRLTPLGGSVVVPAGYTPSVEAPGEPVAPAPTADASPRSLRELARARAGTAELLVFRIAGERFGVELAAVEEAIDLEQVHHVPEMPAAMLGVVSVRGALTPVYSPRAPLGVPLAGSASALIFRRGAARVALAIDDVEDVLTLDLGLLREAPGVEAGDGVLLGVVRTADLLLALVDADALLAACRSIPALETA